MNPDKVRSELDNLWRRYQEILNNPTWEDLNEARAILYLTGNLYCEKIALEAIERRLHLIDKKLNIIDFLAIIDSRSNKPSKLRKNNLFQKLEEFYIVIKNYKNKFSRGKYYLDEERFIKLYNKYNPEYNFEIREKGKHGNKKIIKK